MSLQLPNQIARKLEYFVAIFFLYTGALNAHPNKVIQEVITVTARHVKEDVTDVPITINIIDGEDLKQHRLESLEDVFMSIPGVEISSSGDTSSANVRIRGVGAINKTSRDDSSVVIYIDGVPQPIGYSSLGTLDIESVEVLKGSQGTLFGRNSDAGAIQINSGEVIFDQEGYFRAEAGQDNLLSFQGVYNHSISNELAVRFAVGTQQQDHHFINAYTKKPLTSPREANFRAKVNWRINDNLNVKFSSAHQRLRNSPFVYSTLPHSTPPSMGAPDGVLDDDRDIDQWSIRINANLHFAQLTSISAINDSNDQSTGIIYEGNAYNRLLGFVPANHGKTSNRFDRRFYNQEFRLNSKSGSPFFWVTGIHLYYDKANASSFGFADPYFFPKIVLNSSINKKVIDTQSQAIYGELTYPFTNELSYTFGLRYTRDNKKFNVNWAPNQYFPDPPFQHIELAQDLTDNYFTGRVALNYKANDNLSIYGVYAKGYKSGGFADRGANILLGKIDTPYAPSKVDSLELGIKSNSNNNLLRINASIFVNDVKDDHIFTYNFLTQESAPENFDTQSKGAELELDWHLEYGLSVQAGLNYTDATIVEIPSNSFANVPEGSRIPNSAYWSGNMSINHQHPIIFGQFNDLMLQTNLSINYVGERAGDPSNTLVFDSYKKVNLKAGISSDNYQVYIWGDNLLDNEIHTSGLVINLPASTLARGRQVGLGIEYTY